MVPKIEKFDFRGIEKKRTKYVYAVPTFFLTYTYTANWLGFNLDRIVVAASPDVSGLFPQLAGKNLTKFAYDIRLEVANFANVPAVMERSVVGIFSNGNNLVVVGNGLDLDGQLAIGTLNSSLFLNMSLLLDRSNPLIGGSQTQWEVDMTISIEVEG